MEKVKLVIFDLDDTLYLYTAKKEYKEVYWNDSLSAISFNPVMFAIKAASPPLGCKAITSGTAVEAS